MIQNIKMCRLPLQTEYMPGAQRLIVLLVLANLHLSKAFRHQHTDVFLPESYYSCMCYVPSSSDLPGHGYGSGTADQFPRVA